MPENEKHIAWHSLKLIAELSVEGSDSEKLQASLAYRAKSDLEGSSEELGTAEHRPRHGLVYDAPLGLKF